MWDENVSADRFSSGILSVLGLDVPLAVSKINHCAIPIRHHQRVYPDAYNTAPYVRIVSRCQTRGRVTAFLRRLSLRWEKAV